MFYQIVSRKNDINGNPYRLIFEYDRKCKLIQVSEVHTSLTSNRQTQLDVMGYMQIEGFHIGVAEYNFQRRTAHKRRMLNLRD
jgi:hypothetical protein